MEYKIGDIVKRKDIYEIEGVYFCFYESGIKGVSNAGFHPKGFWTMVLNGELENYNPLKLLINNYVVNEKIYPLIILKGKKKLKDLSFEISKIYTNK